MSALLNIEELEWFNRLASVIADKPKNVLIKGRFYPKNEAYLRDSMVVWVTKNEVIVLEIPID